MRPDRPNLMNRERSAHQTYLQQRTFGSLDGIRCVAILAVLFHHGSGGLELGRLTTRGFLGVDLFFVLSGFLIVTLLLRERDRHGRISLRDFYMRRTVRIFPLYYGTVAFYAVVVGVIRTGGSQSVALPQDLLILLTYTANWFQVQGMLGIAWSLAAEEQFYLVWPAVERGCRHSMWILAALMAASVLVVTHLVDGPLEAWFGWSRHEPRMLRETTFIPILLGVLLAHVLHHPRGYVLFRKLLGQPWMSLLWAAALVGACEVLPGDLQGWPRLIIHMLMFAFLGSCVVQERHALSKPLSLRPVARLGALSYGVYLLHMFVLDLADRLIARGLPLVSQFPVLLLGSWLVAELSFRFYELPFLRLKARFAR